MSLEKLLKFWRGDPEIRGNIVSWEISPPRSPRLHPFPDSVVPTLKSTLERSGIGDLFAHQLTAFQRVKSGQNIILITGTASGKTLSYNLPILNHILTHPNARALYIFPTKALAQDQLSNLQSITRPINPENPLMSGTYDGDTPPRQRKTLRDSAQILITNPDMLHLGILPHHPNWAQFLRNLEFIVIDESHAYRGVFGSHVANVFRRLNRVSASYTASPQYFLTSATIGNPLELAHSLTGKDFTEIRQDFSSRGEQNFLIYNPPLVDKELGIRKSALAESVRLVSDLVAYNIQTILFAGTRRGVELALSGVKRESMIDGSRVRGYRSGYLPAERREIEAGLREGRIQVVAATNALELGIDIGQMGASVLSSFPGTIASTWQQAGRAGRGEKASVAILVASASPMDQFLARHPGYFHERSPEYARIDPDNLLILFNHLRCALFELPFQGREGYGRFSAEEINEILDMVVQSGDAYRSNGKVTWVSDSYPADAVSLRSASVSRVLLHEEGDTHRPLIGEVDFESAHWMVHPGAVYLHQGRQYLVDQLDLEGLTALLSRVELDYYTLPKSDTSIEIESEKSHRQVSGGITTHGELQVTSRVVGFHKIHWETQERLDLVPLEMPATELQTSGYWITLDEALVDRLRELGLWSNDPNRYGPQWPEIRQRVRARDAYRCQVCGALERDTAHHVHHKVPFRTFLDAAQANRMDNLITLCPACHQRAEAVVRMRSGLAGLAYTIGNLAPLFLMCDSRDLGVHSDPQSPMAKGQPTITFYDRAPGGIGLSSHLFDIHTDLVKSALNLVRECPCEDGCPSCVGPPGELGFGGKSETQALLSALAK